MRQAKLRSAAALLAFAALETNLHYRPKQEVKRRPLPPDKQSLADMQLHTYCINGVAIKAYNKTSAKKLYSKLYKK